ASADAGPNGRLDFPAGAWIVPRPVQPRHPGQTWAGENGYQVGSAEGVSFLMTSSGNPAVWLSAAQGLPFDASAHKPDAYGKLDASIAPTPGVARGLRSNGTHYISDFSSPLS